MTPISFKRHRFPPEIIQHAVWLYARFTLSFRDVEDLLAERGIDVSNETVRRWFLKFGRLVAGNLRRSRPRASARWHLDEMVIKIRDRRYWLWRAVDDEGEVLDFLVQPRRCARSARTIAAKAAEEAGLCAEAHHHGQAQILSPSPFAKNGCLRFTIRDCGRTIGLKTHTSRCGDESENSSGSNRRDQPNGSCRSMPPSTTPSTSNAIFCRAASSSSFELKRLLSGGAVGLPLKLGRDPTFNVRRS